MTFEEGFPIHEEDLLEDTSIPRPKMIAVGGGRGGVGKSLVATNLAVYLAQLGKSVALVDCDLTGSNIHAHFGLSAAARDPARVEPFDKALVSTAVPGLKLLPAPHDAVETPLLARAGRKSKYLRLLYELRVEYLVVDVGPGATPFALDAMLIADLPLAVTVPEPPAIESTYRFIRALVRRQLKHALERDRFRLPVVERLYKDLGKLPSPIALVKALRKADRSLADFAWLESQKARLQLIVNQTRVRTDMELGGWMSALCSRHYGVPLDELGHIEHDDTVWVSVRKMRPLLLDNPTSKAARNLERIARRVLALLQSRKEAKGRPPPFPEDLPTLYATLGVTRSANDEEVRRAFKRQKEIYATGGLATASLLGDAELRAEQARLDEAYDTLLDPMRRRAYDLSTFPEVEGMRDPLSAKTTRPGLDAEALLLRAELQREVGPDTEFTGALLRRVRESQGIEIAEVAARTKIGRSHLVAIEEEAYDALPAVVYVRGFVAELAKTLKLDSVQVTKTYLRRLREAQGSQGREGSRTPHGKGS